MHRRTCQSEVNFLTSYGVERVKAQKDANTNAIISSRSQMMEVCSESSFQPLIQLYLLFPTLIMSFSQSDDNPFNTNQSVHDWFNSVSDLQFWSILTSCLSLSWSFNYYQSLKKNGALGFGSNPIGRIILLMANIYQVSSRLIAFVLFAYSFGDGNFLPMFLAVMVHISLMSLIHYYQMNKTLVKLSKRTKFQTVYQSILNGISNLYL